MVTEGAAGHAAKSSAYIVGVQRSNMFGYASETRSDGGNTAHCGLARTLLFIGSQEVPMVCWSDINHSHLGSLPPEQPVSYWDGTGVANCGGTKQRLSGSQTHTSLHSVLLLHPLPLLSNLVVPKRRGWGISTQEHHNKIFPQFYEQISR